MSTSALLPISKVVSIRQLLDPALAVGSEAFYFQIVFSRSSGGVWGKAFRLETAGSKCLLVCMWGVLCLLMCWRRNIFSFSAKLQINYGEAGVLSVSEFPLLPTPVDFFFFLKLQILPACTCFSLHEFHISNASRLIWSLLSQTDRVKKKIIIIMTPLMYTIR